MAPFLSLASARSFPHGLSFPPSNPALRPLSQIEARFAPCVCPTLLEQNAKKEFSRKRIYSRARTFWCWIWQILQGNTSCREVVRQVQALFALAGAGPVDEDTAGYCLARSKLSLAWLQKVFQGSPVLKAAACGRLLQGRPLRVSDGSGTRLADTPKNRQAYPPNNPTPGTGFPYMRFTVLLCLASGAILARALGTLRTQETQHLPLFHEALRKDDILIADRAYGLFVMAALLQSWTVDLIARVSTRNRRVDYRQAIKKLGLNDALFTWKKGPPSKLVSSEQWAALDRGTEGSDYSPPNCQKRLSHQATNPGDYLD
jgi:hypothetical protein